MTGASNRRGRTVMYTWFRLLVVDIWRSVRTSCRLMAQCLVARTSIYYAIVDLLSTHCSSAASGEGQLRRKRMMSRFIFLLRPTSLSASGSHLGPDPTPLSTNTHAFVHSLTRACCIQTTF